MPYFRIVHKGVTHFIEADINQQALSQLGIASTADYQLKKITKEVYETGIKTKPPVTKSISTPFKTPDVSWSPVGAEPTATTPTTQEATTPTGDVDYSRATPASELTPGGTGEERFGVGATEPTPTETEETDSYNNYLEWLEGEGMENVPRYSRNEWLLRRDEIVANLSYYQAGYTQDQIDSFDAFQAFGSRYGNLEDFTPKDLADYLENYDQAQQQLEAWITEAGPEAAGFTDDQIRELNDYKQWYYKHGKPGDLMPVDASDFITNYDKFQGQLSTWKQIADEEEQYELDPAEAARRREEAYEESRYAAEERYGETPRYGEAFTQWLGGQETAGGALQQFIEREYPSLKSEFGATQPRMTGFPTREEARAEASRRESAWTGWLSEMTPEIEQRYYAQRPTERGERLWMQAPTMRAVNW